MSVECNLLYTRGYASAPRAAFSSVISSTTISTKILRTIYTWETVVLYSAEIIAKRLVAIVENAVRSYVLRFMFYVYIFVTSYVLRFTRFFRDPVRFLHLFLRLVT